MFHQIEGTHRAFGAGLETALNAICVEDVETEKGKDVVPLAHVVVTYGALALLTVVGTLD